MTIPKETAQGTGTFTLTPTQDTIAEGDETIDVTGTADGFTVTKAQVTLTDDETAPASITLTTSPTSVLEDDLGDDGDGDRDAGRERDAASGDRR